MKISFVGKIEEIIDGAALLADQLGFEIADGGAEIRVGTCQKGYSVSVSDGGAEILYERRTDFFRGLSIAIDALREGKEKQESAEYCFDTCGLMLDLSRRGVLKVEGIHKVMRYMACMGLNRLGLYTEDTYEIEGYPYFGYLRGRYTKQEIREIVRYGNIFGIETVPYIQTLAHLERALRWNAFSSVRDSWDTLLPYNEETYRLIESMIKTVSECYDTDKVHIGMDEAYTTGRGRFLDLYGFKNRTDILLDHLNKVVEITEKYNMKPMMWGDMFLDAVRSCKDDEDRLEKLRTSIPKGVTLVYWSYGQRSEKTYDEGFKNMEKLNCPVSFTGGVCTWLGPGVNYTMSLESSLASLREAKRHGVNDIMASLWGDGGAECDIFAAMLGWQYFADFNYKGDFRKFEELEESFRVCTGMSARDFLLFDCDNYNKLECPLEADVVERDGMPISLHAISRQVLYQNPMLGIYDKSTEVLDLRTHYSELRERFAGVKIPERFKNLFESYKQVLCVLEKKCDVGNRLTTAYANKDNAALAEMVPYLEDLACEIEKMYELRSRLWHEHNKPFGFEEVGNRMMASAGMTRHGAKRIKAYLSGEESSLPELEAERLPSNPSEFPLTIEWGMPSIPMP